MKKDCCLNEKDVLFDILTGEKNLVKLYASAMTEAVGKDVRKTVKANMTETFEDQFKVFETMQKSGYYETAIADKSVVDEKINTFSKELKCIEKC